VSAVDKNHFSDKNSDISFSLLQLDDVFSVSINDMLCYVTIIILVPYLYWLKQHDPWHHKTSHILDIEASKATISGGDHDGQRKVRRVNCEQLGE